MSFELDGSRRSVLKACSAGVGLGFLPAVSGAASSGGDHEPVTGEDMLVEGTKHVRTDYRPDGIAVKTTYRSEDLTKRYGITPPEFSTEIAYPRDDPEADPFPVTKTETVREPWETLYGSRSEWAAYHETRRRTRSAGGVSIQSGPFPVENEECGIPYYTYEYDTENDNWMQKSPINLVCLGFDLSTVIDVFLDEAVTYFAADIVEVPRYVWDSDKEAFLGPDCDPGNQFASVGEGSLRLDGGYHLKCYELEPGMVSIAAHEDTAVPHSVDSYNSARAYARDVLEIYANVETTYTYTMSGQPDQSTDYKKDHDGEAHVLLSPEKTISADCDNETSTLYCDYDTIYNDLKDEYEAIT